jgi:hypothetical protein
MNFLAILWIASLVTLLALGLSGLRATSSGASVSHHPGSFRELLEQELRLLWGAFKRLIARGRPHADRVLFRLVDRVALQVNSLRASVAKRIFGRIQIEKGPAASFYLKNIAENKETLRVENDTARGAAY